MSGQYLHGLVIDGDVIVEDNIFSHSELREKYTGHEALHPMIREWSWDYVEGEFICTPEELRSLCQGWLDTNLATYAQLRAWLARNWVGLVCGDEMERERHIWALLTLEATSTDPLVEAFLRAIQNWRQATQNWRQATQNWKMQAIQNWDQAIQNWDRAYQNWEQAYQNWDQAIQDWKMQAIQNWKMQVMKPMFFDLLDQFVVPQWRDSRL